MKQQIICPKCFARYPEQQRLLVCRESTCKNMGVPVAQSPAHMEDGQPFCMSCGREITIRVCPICGFEFSGTNLHAEMLGISMVGAEGSGKSHFLSVVVNSIKKEMARVYGCSLYPLGGDNTVEQYYRQYYAPLFEQGRCVSSTAQEDVEPLIYALVFPKDGSNGKTSNLTFYDACGANFRSVREMEKGNRSIYNSRGILFLIDPTQFEAIRDRRKAQGHTVCEVDPSTLLSRIITLIRSSGGQSDLHQKITIPIAVCLTKLDIVRPWMDAGSFIGAQSRHLRHAGFDSIDFNCCNLEIISMIQSWAGSDLVNQVTSQFATWGFFAFSALGEEPAADGKIAHIRPHRVMDPLLWILQQNQIIGLAQ